VVTGEEGERDRDGKEGKERKKSSLKKVHLSL